MRLFLASIVLACLGWTAAPADCRGDDQPPQTSPTQPASKSPPAAKPAASKSAAVKPPAARPAAPLSAEREAAALAFAREQHPELAALIEKLRKDNRHQFDRAIRELAQDRERLLRLKKQSPPLYELALAAWKLDSRAHLLAARMTVSQDPALEAELKQVLRDRVDVRLTQLIFERGRLQDRLAVVDKTIEKIEADKQAVADGDLQRIKRSIARSRRPAPKNPTKKLTPDESRPSSPVVAERPRVPADKTSASATDAASGQNKSKQD